MALNEWLLIAATTAMLSQSTYSIQIYLTSNDLILPQPAQLGRPLSLIHVWASVPLQLKPLGPPESITTPKCISI